MPKITIQVEEDVPAILEQLAGGPRQIGGYITKTARAIHSAELYAGDDLAMMLLMLRTVAGQTKQLDARLARLEAANLTPQNQI
jgi:hypothetical protein